MGIRFRETVTLSLHSAHETKREHRIAPLPVPATPTGAQRRSKPWETSPPRLDPTLHPPTGTTPAPVPSPRVPEHLDPSADQRKPIIRQRHLAPRYSKQAGAAGYDVQGDWSRSARRRRPLHSAHENQTKPRSSAGCSTTPTGTQVYTREPSSSRLTHAPNPSPCTSPVLATAPHAFLVRILPGMQETLEQLDLTCRWSKPANRVVRPYTVTVKTRIIMIKAGETQDTSDECKALRDARILDAARERSPFARSTTRTRHLARSIIIVPDTRTLHRQAAVPAAARTASSERAAGGHSATSSRQWGVHRPETPGLRLEVPCRELRSDNAHETTHP
ncbi:hypothetical protein R3P38DRAFT_3184114 [Favolaschia claudopus]|uniref:Uncharacterized protein n=1 Tax=Favolaschia claudopus TaxID=2862362 RepID=A0AAW0CFF0_9AGAR